MKKILSIAIPTYYMEALLPRCLDSFIVHKNFMDMIEVIIVNDGSKDRSSEIAHNYAERYPNTYKVIDKPNGNYGSCINVALKIATGKYFRICDADDCYNNGNLEKYIDFLTTTDADIVFTPYNMYHEKKIESTFCVPEDFRNKTFNIDDLNWASDELELFRRMHCTATKKDILIKNNYYQTEGISYTDTQFIFYSYLYAQTCTFFDNVIYIYFLGRDGQTMSQESIIKSHMHFYENANKMLDDYLMAESEISENKSKILEMSIIPCISYFSTVVLCHIPYQRNKIKLLKELRNKTKQAVKGFKNETYLLSRPYKMWREYHIPAIIINLLCIIKSHIRKQK